MKIDFKRISWCCTIALALAFTACSDSDKEVPENNNNSSGTENNNKPTTTAENEMNETIDKFLQGYYLWNDEYKGMTRDLSIPYVDSYENFLQTTLMKMTTNKLDKKKNAQGNYVLYSFIDRKEKKTGSKSASAGVTHGIEKDDKEKSFGISRMSIVTFVDDKGLPTGEYGFVVQSVYPASAAATFGVNRGNFIYEVNGEVITEKNYMSVYLDLLQPTNSSVTLLVGDGKKKPEEISLMATEIEKTPIIMNTVIEEGGHKIAYLHYDAFDAGYDNDLLKVLADFKSKGVTDMVLDLRYNGGGHVITSMMLSGCFAGSSVQGKVFQYYRYNDARMKTIDLTKKETGNDYDSASKYFYDHFVYDNYYGVNLASYDLSHVNIYVLTTKSTASASELLISSLRGVDVPVTVIGEKSNGKNVGMEVKDFDKGNYSYELAPITFQYYNAKHETVPETGITVDYQVTDWNDGYVNFGEKNEPMLAKAIQLITGTSAKAADARSTSAVCFKPASVELPDLDTRRPQGAIVYHPEAMK